MRPSVLLITTSLALLVPGVASATATFPGAVSSDLMLGYVPPCTICHETDAGGPGTVTRAFGKAMRMHGLVEGDTSSLQAALTAMETDKVDSDCDGVIDVQQLKDGRNPNTGEFIDGSGKPNPSPDAGCASMSSSSGGDTGPAYGCGARVAPGEDTPTPWQAAAALAVAIGLALTRRRRA